MRLHSAPPVSKHCASVTECIIECIIECIRHHPIIICTSLTPALARTRIELLTFTVALCKLGTILSKPYCMLHAISACLLFILGEIPSLFPATLHVNPHSLCPPLPPTLIPSVHLFLLPSFPLSTSSSYPHSLCPPLPPTLIPSVHLFLLPSFPLSTSSSYPHPSRYSCVPPLYKPDAVIHCWRKIE